MNTIIAIDPGTTQSGYVIWQPEIRTIVESGINSNHALLQYVRARHHDLLAVEMMESQGMAVGKSTFETLVWIGRFIEACERDFQLVHRSRIKLHHCGNSRAKDSNIRQSLIDKYGAPGRKASPGVTYGLSSHSWQAFAVATLISEGGELITPRNEISAPILNVA